MNAARRVLWCVGLVLLLTLAGAIGGDASQERVPGAQPLPETSLTKPGTVRLATAAEPTDGNPTGGSQSPSSSSLVAQTAPAGTEELDSGGSVGQASEDHVIAEEEGQQTRRTIQGQDRPAPPPKELSMANRFQDQPTAYVLDADQLSWDAADCGCVPALTTFETYGFYPFWNKKDVGPVNFGIWSRIGYYALTPDEAGHVQAPAGWMASHGRKAAAVPQRYGTKVDLVISNDKWAVNTEAGQGLPLTTNYVLMELVDNVVGLVSGFGFDGATIDFDFSAVVQPRPYGQRESRKIEKTKRQYVQSYLLFMKQLRKGLKEQNPELRLHAVLHYVKDAKGEHIPFFTRSELRELIDSVDLLLFLPQLTPSLDEPTQVQAMKQYDEYFAEYTYGESAVIEKKLVFVLDAEGQALDMELADIRSDRFRGVGGWMLRKGIDLKMTRKWADPVFAQDRGYVDRFDSNVLPSPFCTLVCPNRSIFIAVIVALMTMYVGAFFLSFFSPVVETLVNTYRREVIGGGLVIVVLVGSLFFCVPQWSMGWATELTLVFLLLVGAYALYLMQVKKREVNYP